MFQSDSATSGLDFFLSIYDSIVNKGSLLLVFVAIFRSNVFLLT